MRAALGVIAALCSFMACVGEDPDPTPGSSSGGGGPSARRIQCNDKQCAASEVCCLTLGGGSVDKAECTPENACPTGTALLCDDTADCEAGLKCCVKTNGGSVRYGPSFCNTTCDSPDRQLCGDPADCSTGSCAPPQSSTTPTNLKECK